MGEAAKEKEDQSKTSELYTTDLVKDKIELEENLSEPYIFIEDNTPTD